MTILAFILIAVGAVLIIGAARNSLGDVAGRLIQ